MIAGPHCPKCGASDHWDWYSGPPDDPDAYSCEMRIIDGIRSERCGYVRWIKNAPSPPVPTAPRAHHSQTDAANAMRSLAAKRARVRALVFALLASDEVMRAMQRHSDDLVDAAVRLDAQIEALT
jgi:hypothetical protein